VIHLSGKKFIDVSETSRRCSREKLLYENRSLN